jgi:hypothetical protein
VIQRAGPESASLPLFRQWHIDALDPVEIQTREIATSWPPRDKAVERWSCSWGSLPHALLPDRAVLAEENGNDREGED